FAFISSIVRLVGMVRSSSRTFDGKSSLHADLRVGTIKPTRRGAQQRRDTCSPSALSSANGAYVNYLGSEATLPTGRNVPRAHASSPSATGLDRGLPRCATGDRIRLNLRTLRACRRAR